MCYDALYPFLEVNKRKKNLNTGDCAGLKKKLRGGKSNIVIIPKLVCLLMSRCTVQKNLLDDLGLQYF